MTVCVENSVELDGSEKPSLQKNSAQASLTTSSHHFVTGLKVKRRLNVDP